MDIAVRLAGGLGNQLFQFAAAVCLAKHNNLGFSNILLDTRFLSSYESKHNFDIGFVTKCFQSVQVSPKLPLLISMASRFRLAKFVNMKLGSFELISDVTHFDSACSNVKLSSTFILDGYFQYPKILFFEEERTWLRDTLLEKHHLLIDQVKNKSSTIGIHIRRGDYITSKSASKIFRNISLKYYNTALSMVSDGSKILVFSDDSELSASFALEVGGFDIRKLSLTLEQEFCLLMSCDHHIIANSTFSWWAA